MTYSCSLCGYRFAEDEMSAQGCGNCPSSPGGCGLVRCPACGYEWPPESRSFLATLMAKVFPGKERSRDET